MRDIWLAGLYAAVVGATATAVGAASGVVWVTGAGAASLGLGLALLVMFWPSAWCLVVRVRGGRVRHWHRPKAAIVKCGRSAGLRADWRR
jgi:hypothetical protein